MNLSDALVLLEFVLGTLDLGSHLWLSNLELADHLQQEAIARECRLRKKGHDVRCDV